MTPDVELSAYDWGHAGKMAYLDREDAEYEAAYLASVSGDDIHAYRCGVCALWHVGHVLDPDVLAERALRRAGPFEVLTYQLPDEPPPPDPRWDLLALALLGTEPESEQER